jgi:hypothetical protein
MLPARRPSNSELRYENYKRSIQHPTCADWADGGRQPFVWTFLMGGLGSPKPDEDVVASVVGISRTCWTSGQGVRPVSSPPVGGPPSARGCFSQHSMTVDLVRKLTTSRCGEGALHRGDEGGRVAPHSISPSLKDAYLGETSIPCLFAPD